MIAARRTGPRGSDRTLGPALVCLAVAFPLWFAVFRVPVASFWLKISLAALLLAAVSLLRAAAPRSGARPPAAGTLFRLKAWHPAAGVLSALLLYLVFIAGKLLLTALFPSSGAAIDSVYAPRSGLPLWLIGLLLAVVTGPAEEIFWRGLLQRALADRLNPTAGLLLATAAYSLVHVSTLNLPLMLAALTAGLVWGYLFLRSGSLWPGMISHSLWSLAIFVLFPVAGG